MPQLSPRAVIAAGLAATMAVALPAAIGSSNAQPANKAVAAGANLQTLDSSATPVNILSATFKTSKPEDLLMSVSLECSIITNVFVPGSTTAGASSSGEAQGTVKVWLTIDSDTNIVAMQDTSQPPQDPSQQASGTDADKITFCNRDHKVTLTDAEQPQDGVDQLEEYQSTKTANDFNWIRLNAGSGDHIVKVWAEFDTPDPTAAQSGTSYSQGYVGNRTLTIEPTKLANNAVIGTTGTN